MKRVSAIETTEDLPFTLSLPYETEFTLLGTQRNNPATFSSNQEGGQEPVSTTMGLSPPACVWG